MKGTLPFHLLLALAIVTCGAVVFYNLALREQFAVRVSYQLPLVESAEASTAGQEAVVTVPQPAGEALHPPENSGGEERNPAWGIDTEETSQSQEDAVESVAFPLELNGASVAQLQFIPGVGEVLSQRIVQYREVLGGYSRLEQLKEIKGIGDGTYGKISAYLYVAAEEALSWDVEDTEDSEENGE